MNATICGIVCHCGPNYEPLACAYTAGHDGPHSWGNQPTPAVAAYTEFTPGPWWVEREESAFGWITVRAHETHPRLPKADCALATSDALTDKYGADQRFTRLHQNSWLNKRKALANAHLVSAAPELYTAAEYAAEILKARIGEDDARRDECLKQLEEAMAKARGERWKGKA